MNLINYVSAFVIYSKEFCFQKIMIQKSTWEQNYLCEVRLAPFKVALAFG